MGFIHTPVGQNQDIDGVPAGLVTAGKKGTQRVPQGVGCLIKKGNGPDRERRMPYRTNTAELLLGQNRRKQLQHGGVVRPVRQQIAVITDIDGAVRFDFFPQGVNRRIRYLCEPLPEIIGQDWMCFGKYRLRFIRSHGNNGFRTVLGHGQQDVMQILPGIMEGFAELLPAAFIRGNRQFRVSRQLVQPELMLHPFPVRMLCRVSHFQFFALPDCPPLQICFQDVAALQLPAPENMRVLLEQHAGFGGKDQAVIIGQSASERAKAVAVQGGTDLFSVRVQNCRRSVPGLHHGGVIPVQITPGRFRFSALPRLRQEDHARQGQWKTVHGQKLQRIVQHLAVASAFCDNGQNPPHLFAHHRRKHGLLPGFHAVMVSTDRVDFAVMQQHPLWMRLAPGWEGIGGKPGMHHGHPAHIAHVLKVIVERPKLVDQHHPLINDGSAGKRTDIGIRVLLFEHPAQHIQPPVEIQPAGDVCGTFQKALPDPWHGAPGPGAELGRVAGDISPPQHRDALRNGKLFKNTARLIRPDFILRQKEHPHAILARIAQEDSFLLGPGCKKQMRKVRHDPDAVARRSEGVAARPVRQPFHDGQRLVYRTVRRLAGQIGDGADAAAFVLQFRMIQGIKPVLHGYASVLFDVLIICAA